MNEIKTANSTNNFKYLVDTFMVLLNLSTSYSLIPYLVFRNYDRYVNMIMLFVLNIIYLIIRFGIRKRKTPDFLPKRKKTLVILYLIINISCLFSGLISNTGWKSTIVYFILNLEFYWILCRLFDDYLCNFTIQKSFYLLFRGYLSLVLLSLFSCAIMFTYIKMGGNPNQNPIDMRFDLFYDNAVNLGAAYCFPLNLCIVDVSPDIRIPFFQEAGLLTGFYHEPHCLTFMVFPALFLFLYYSNSLLKKILWFLFYLFIVLISASTTNIVAILVTLVVYMLYTFKNSLSRSILLVLIVALIIGGVFLYVDLTTFEFIFNKLESGSMEYSVSTIDFALHPRSIFGTSFYNLSYVNSSKAAKTMDVGFVSFILNALFLIICVLQLMKLYKKDSAFSLMVLLSSVYFFAHSAKVAMVTYSLSMLIFIVFLIQETPRFSDSQFLKNERIPE